MIIRVRAISRARLGALLILVSLPGTVGCFSEQSFSIRASDIVHVSSDAVRSPVSTRQWLARTHQALCHLLPLFSVKSLLTDDLTDERGRPVDVFAHFGRNPALLQTLFFNYWGLAGTAQSSGRSFQPEHPSSPWPGFEEVRIPVSDNVETIGWLGLARRGDTIRDADCIVILSGLLGHNDIKRTEDLAVALRAVGFHVLAYENRGYGRSDLARPDVPYTFGVMTTRDLMLVSDWLEALPHVRRTGLVGYCWSANQALLAAWYENLPEDDDNISTGIAKHLPPLPARRRFRAGVVAFSPTLAYEEIIDKLETPQSYSHEPVLAFLQDAVRDRMLAKHYPEVSGSLAKLIDLEFARSKLYYPGVVRDSLRFMRWLPYRGLPAGDKLSAVRIPTLIVHASNDPLATAQEVADLVAGVHNPNVAAVIHDYGGHVAFSSHARRYYYSLIVNFFDPEVGAAAMTTSPMASSR